MGRAHVTLHLCRTWHLEVGRQALSGADIDMSNVDMAPCGDGISAKEVAISKNAVWSVKIPFAHHWLALLRRAWWPEWLSALNIIDSWLFAVTKENKHIELS